MYNSVCRDYYWGQIASDFHTTVFITNQEKNRDSLPQLFQVGDALKLLLMDTLKRLLKTLNCSQCVMSAFVIVG